MIFRFRLTVAGFGHRLIMSPPILSWKGLATLPVVEGAVGLSYKDSRLKLTWLFSCIMTLGHGFVSRENLAASEYRDGSEGTPAEARNETGLFAPPPGSGGEGDGQIMYYRCNLRRAQRSPFAC